MNDFMTSVPVLLVLGAILIPVGVFAYLGIGERLLTLVSPRLRVNLRPWYWISIPLILAVVILVYPLLNTVYLAFTDAEGHGWVGWDNFAWSFGEAMRPVLRNNVLWLTIFPLGTLILAMLAAVLFDRVEYEKLAVTLIVLPTAVSFTAGAVIWRQIYTYSPGNMEQRGLLNALWTLIPGAEPIAWLQTPILNTLALIFVAIWLGLGLSTLILSAAIKNVPTELVEAMRLDGAGEVRIFFQLTLPVIWPAVLVVVTHALIAGLKTFDIVYVMTNGNYETDVIANRMYSELFAANNLGHASAIAVLLLVCALPVVALNIRSSRMEEKV